MCSKVASGEIFQWNSKAHRCTAEAEDLGIGGKGKASQ